LDLHLYGAAHKEKMVLWVADSLGRVYNPILPFMALKRSGAK